MDEVWLGGMHCSSVSSISGCEEVLPFYVPYEERKTYVKIEAPFSAYISLNLGFLILILAQIKVKEISSFFSVCNTRREVQ